LFAGHPRPGTCVNVTERYVDRDPDVLEGDDEIPRQPAPPRDPYTPEPGPRQGERRAFRVLWIAVLVLAALVALVVYAALR
jgi:hypothetical protein